MTQSVTVRKGGLVGRATCAAALVLLALTGCGGTSAPSSGSDLDPSAARQSIVDLVERSTAAVGGDWEVYRGPAVEPCGQDVEDRVRYVYIVERAGSAAAPERDVDSVRAVWRDAGVDVVETGTGGGSTRVGVRGTSGPVTSVGFDAAPDRYSMSGVSVCAAGNATELRDEEFRDEG